MSVMFGVMLLHARTRLATRMSERHDFQEPALRSVVDEVSDAGEKQPTNLVWPGELYPRAYPRLFSQGRKGSLKVAPYRARSSGSVLRPPMCSYLDLPLGARLDPDDERQCQPNFCSRVNNSSAEIPSSRSASSRASTSSASSAGESFTADVSSRARTATAVPSGRAGPSITTLPSTTVPKTTCIRRFYSSMAARGRRPERLSALLAPSEPKPWLSPAGAVRSTWVYSASLLAAYSQASAPRKCLAKLTSQTLVRREAQYELPLEFRLPTVAL